MSAPVKFDRPPVNEVACGVMFQPIGLGTVHIGLFWETLSAEFPGTQDAPPLQQLIEDMTSSTTQFQLSALSMPEMRRTWFISADGRSIVQIQEDRLLFNWKRTSPSDEYPSYEIVIQKFEHYLSAFHAFAEKAGLKQPIYRQFELNYVNVIGEDNGLAAGGFGGVLIDHQINQKEHQFLPELERFNWNTSYKLPNLMGRLHVTAHSALTVPDAKKVMRLEFTARGFPPAESKTGMREWFDIGHEWITRGFADATTPTLHKIWNRKS